MLNQKIVDTAESLRLASRNIPKIWDGRKAILEMKEGSSNLDQNLEIIRETECFKTRT
jgi:hypothetical protein